MYNTFKLIISKQSIKRSPPSQLPYNLLITLYTFGLSFGIRSATTSSVI